MSTEAKPTHTVIVIERDNMKNSSNTPVISLIKITERTESEPYVTGDILNLIDKDSSPIVIFGKSVLGDVYYCAFVHNPLDVFCKYTSTVGEAKVTKSITAILLKEEFKLNTRLDAVPVVKSPAPGIKRHVCVMLGDAYGNIVERTVFDHSAADNMTYEITVIKAYNRSEYNCIVEFLSVKNQEYSTAYTTLIGSVVSRYIILKAVFTYGFKLPQSLIDLIIWQLDPGAGLIPAYKLYLENPEYFNKESEESLYKALKAHIKYALNYVDTDGKVFKFTSESLEKILLA